jgi:hypothetical protein
MGTNPRPPDGLGTAGRSFWRSVVAVYDLSPVEKLMLGQAAAVADLLARADAELAQSDLTVVGSTGQPRAHPLLAASAVQRGVLDVLVRALALPMPDEKAGRRRTPTAAAAAQARWRGERGSVA